MINTLGYLIDTEGNIVDQNGKEVFKKEILTEAYGQDAQIPFIFRSGKLLKLDGEENDKPLQANSSIRKLKTQLSTTVKDSNKDSPSGMSSHKPEVDTGVSGNELVSGGGAYLSRGETTTGGLFTDLEQNKKGQQSSINSDEKISPPLGTSKYQKKVETPITGE